MGVLAERLGPIRDHVRGAREAPVALVECPDYQCPYCGIAHPMVQALMAALPDEMCFAFRHFPLTRVHPYAWPAAEAAKAAGSQGQFWQMHDLLFEDQEHLAPAGPARPGTPSQPRRRRVHGGSTDPHVRRQGPGRPPEWCVQRRSRAAHLLPQWPPLPRRPALPEPSCRPEPCRGVWSSRWPVALSGGSRPGRDGVKARATAP